MSPTERKIVMSHDGFACGVEKFKEVHFRALVTVVLQQNQQKSCKLSEPQPMVLGRRVLACS
jgi:hypothetical protein